jgi:hypothetical protein
MGYGTRLGAFTRSQVVPSISCSEVLFFWPVGKSPVEGRRETGCGNGVLQPRARGWAVRVGARRQPSGLVRWQPALCARHVDAHARANLHQHRHGAGHMPASSPSCPLPCPLPCPGTCPGLPCPPASHPNHLPPPLLPLGPAAGVALGMVARQQVCAVCHVQGRRRAGVGRR